MVPYTKVRLEVQVKVERHQDMVAELPGMTRSSRCVQVFEPPAFAFVLPYVPCLVSQWSAKFCDGMLQR